MNVLIDTSCWTHALRRKGDEAIRARVQELLAAEQAAWCDMVRLELWNGAASDWDRELLDELEANLKNLPITDDVWQHAIILARRARQNAVTVPATDLVIFACGFVHNVKVEHADKHFALLEELQDG